MLLDHNFFKNQPEWFEKLPEEEWDFNKLSGSYGFNIRYLDKYPDKP